MNEGFNLEEYRQRFAHMTEDSKKELLIKFDRSLLDNENARNFLKEVSRQDESFSVRYLAGKLLKARVVKPESGKVRPEKWDNSEAKLLSRQETSRNNHIESAQNFETMFVHGQTIDLDFDVKAAQLSCVNDIRAFGFFIDMFLYVLLGYLNFQFKLLDDPQYMKTGLFLALGALFKDIVICGRTGLGKKALGMEVIRLKDHQAAGLSGMILRNLTLVGPLVIAEALFLIFFSSDGRRIGDYLAGTKVITKVTSKLTPVGLIVNYVSYFMLFMLFASGVFSGFGYLVNQRFVQKNMIKKEYLDFHELKARVKPAGKWLYGKPGNENKRTIHYENMYKGITVTFSRKYHPDINYSGFSDKSLIKQLKEGTEIGLKSMGTVKGKLQGEVVTIDGYKAYKIGFLLEAGVRSPELRGEHYFLLMNSGYIYTISITRSDREDFNSVVFNFIQGIKIRSGNMRDR